ncbi:MAG: hypothetical protein R3315_05390 [Woeseiaceae bacterium]|nr:hypothetical protein [Woeseiaceae bacterium]
MTAEKDRFEPDDRLTRRARELFDESVDELDAATLSRLNRSRHEALERAAGARGAFSPRRWLPLTGLATATAVAVLVLTLDPNGLEPVRTEAASDFEILLEGDDLEMLEELEFYTWMDLDSTDSHVG